MCYNVGDMNKLLIFDTHAHYEDKAYGNNADELIERILSENVAGFINVGCSLESIPAALQIAERYQTVYASVGIHPHYAGDLPPDYLSRIENWAKFPKVRAIGETGLDYHYDGYIREKQIKVFIEQIDLAKRLNLPVIIHSRDAARDTMDIVREAKPRAVMHCYSGSAEMARELIKLDVLISFTGVLTFKNARKAAEVCRQVPLEMMMLETDCPYMAPEPFRGRTCDSSMTRYTAEKIAQIKGVTVDEVVKTCNNNAKIFFDIDF
jgi:TatD DNase family protein